MSQGRRFVRLRIEGRVQGVGFRIFVEREAQALGLDGWVRNRRDGGVEVLAAGSQGDIDALIAHCHKGPRGSQVAMVKVIGETAIDDIGPGFGVGPTV